MFNPLTRTTRSKAMGLVLGGLLALTAAVPAFADSPHFLKAPTFTDNGVTLTAAGRLAGLGNGPYQVDLTANGIAKTLCTNQGGNAAPGRNPVYRNVSGSDIIDPSEIRNGSATVSVTTNVPEQPSAREAGCPNDNWTATITDVSFSNMSISVYDLSSGSPVLVFTYPPKTRR